ncbi:MAG: LemA family protein [Planctomycetia bacterium]|nr:LemA family protein [Planctomycetia bacterium]
MEQLALVAGIIVVLLVVYVIATYNRLVNLRTLIENAWSNIETELKRRYDLIPNLVSTVKGYAAHEKEVFEKVTQARMQAMQSHGDRAEQARDENQLAQAMRGVLAVAESYPDLKASTLFLALQKELTNTENRIQAARRFYNGNIKDSNSLVRQFPSNLLARWFGFSESAFFEVESALERQPVQVSL